MPLDRLYCSTHPAWLPFVFVIAETYCHSRGLVEPFAAAVTPPPAPSPHSGEGQTVWRSGAVVTPPHLTANGITPLSRPERGGWGVRGRQIPNESTWNYAMG